MTRTPQHHAARSIALVLAAATTLAACADAPTAVPTSATARADAVKFWEDLASTRWNARAADLLVRRSPANGQAAASRILTYLSVAQYRAVLAAEEGKVRSTHPSVSAAVGAASVAVLSAFFPADRGDLEGYLDTDLAAPHWPGAKNQDPASGEAIGRAVGADVLALAASDNYLKEFPQRPAGGTWIAPSNPASITRSLYGTRSFFLTSADQLRSTIPAPPEYLSAEYEAALDVVRQIATSRTPEQIAIAIRWNTGLGPYTAVSWNLIAEDLIRDHHRKEEDAARILAYANAATFDAQIACFDAKFAYWYIRPTQADGSISLVQGITLPNHPSYPSAHSCISSAFGAVLADAFPSERQRLDAMVEEAGLSRIYAGLHYPFDVEAGQTIGRAAAALALEGDWLR